MRILAITLVLFILTSCGGGELLIPKPPTYLRMDLPEHVYQTFENPCGFSFDLSKAFKSATQNEIGGGACTQEIDLGPLNGKLFLFYFPIAKTDTLSKYINFANDKVDDHKLKATAINDQQIIRVKDKVYGTFFEIQGDVATNYQFYLTDSTSRFLRGEILLNCRPNYDSLKPSLDYLKVDLLKMVNTLTWK